MINELIIVEGKSDTQKLKEVFGNDIKTLETSGLGITKDKLELIKNVNEQIGVIIFTDPDGPGKTIRETIINYLNCDVKNAFINKKNFNSNAKKIGIAEANVLEVNFDEVINKYKTNDIKKVSIISNMPYYITSEILFKVFDCSNINFAVFMMQKEVAVRLCANKGENNYNNLSIAAEYYASKKYEFTVNKGMFRPIPKVDSAIVSLDFDKKLSFEIDNDKEFIKFVRKLFNNKRKKQF
ncbi:hypothetical protein FQA39_LY13025 [Lamprigera yunnana]|nr:hypothetical protein FQA39_LY13025 [Lamprigera yunnana]